MKCFVVSHTSALALLARRPDPRHGDTGVESVRLEDVAAPTDQEAIDVIDSLDLGIEFLDVLVFDRSRLRNTAHLKAHLWTRPLPPGSLVSIDYWSKEIVLYVCAPEFVYLQVAAQSDRLETIYAGFSLTADYRIDALAPAGVVNRGDIGCDGRLTSRERIAAYLIECDGLPGIRSATRLLKYVREGSRSPRESGLCMMLYLPTKYGGCALGDATLNKSYSFADGRTRLGDAKRVERIPDIVLEARPEWTSIGEPSLAEPAATRTVAVDYDSDAAHSGSEKMESDVSRRNDMTMIEGVAHFTVTTSQANDCKSMKRLCDRIRRKLRLRKRPIMPSGMNEVDRFDAERAYESRRFELWDKFVRKQKNW